MYTSIVNMMLVYHLLKLDLLKENLLQIYPGNVAYADFLNNSHNLVYVETIEKSRTQLSALSKLLSNLLVYNPTLFSFTAYHKHCILQSGAYYCIFKALDSSLNELDFNCSIRNHLLALQTMSVYYPQAQFDVQLLQNWMINPKLARDYLLET